MTLVIVGAPNRTRMDEAVSAFEAAGFSAVAFRRFPLAAAHLAVWGYIVEATSN